MHYTTVELPIGGHNADNQKHEINVLGLECCIGERADTYTVVHVRGCYSRPRDAVYSFAGGIVLRGGRDAIEYDLAVMENRQLAKEDGEQLAMAISVALDEFASELMEAEMNRICG